MPNGNNGIGEVMAMMHGKWEEPLVGPPCYIHRSRQLLNKVAARIQPSMMDTFCCGFVTHRDRYPMSSHTKTEEDLC